MVAIIFVYVIPMRNMRNPRTSSSSTPIGRSDNEKLNRRHFKIWDQWNARYLGSETTTKRVFSSKCCRVRNQASPLMTSVVYRKFWLAFPLEGWTIGRPRAWQLHQGKIESKVRSWMSMNHFSRSLERGSKVICRLPVFDHRCTREFRFQPRPVRRVTMGWASGRPHLPGFGFFLTALTPHRFLATALRLDHDRHLPTTERPGKGYPRLEYRHRCPEPRKGRYEYHTGKPCLRLCRHPSHHDPGELPSLL